MMDSNADYPYPYLVEECDSLSEDEKILEWPGFEEFINDGGDINSPLVLEGPQAGYTALHLAVSFEDLTDYFKTVMKENSDSYKDDEFDNFMQKRLNLIKKLIKKYNARVDSTAEDGAQPIHLACFNRRYCDYMAEFVYKAIEILLNSGADLNTIITKPIFNKYSYSDEEFYRCHQMKWTDDFGGTISLIIFAVLFGDTKLMELLIEKNVDFAIKDINNKTLLMYLFEVDPVKYYFLHLTCKPEYVNARDNDGFHIVHYLLPYKDFDQQRYDKRLVQEKLIGTVVKRLKSSKADLNAMVNDKESSLLINMAAQRCYLSVLKVLMDLQDAVFCDKAKPLKNTFRDVDESKYVFTEYFQDESKKLEFYRICPEYFDTDKLLVYRQEDCFRFIIKNYLMRQEFGLFIPEKVLFEQMIEREKNKVLGKFVNTFKETVINDFLKIQTIIIYGHQVIRYYDILNIIFHDDKKLNLLVKNQLFYQAWQNFHYSRINDERDDFKKDLLLLVCNNIRSLESNIRRMELIEKVKKMKKNSMSFLPTTCVLKIIKYLDNYNLEAFISAIELKK